MNKSGLILVCERRNKLVSTAIAVFSRSKYTHTAQTIMVNGVMCIIEARVGGVHIIEFEHWKQKYKQKFEMFDVGLDEIKFESQAIKLAGSGYDILLIGSHAHNAIKKGTQLLLNNKSKFTCSELTATFLGLDNPHTYRPVDIYNYLKTR